MLARNSPVRTSLLFGTRRIIWLPGRIQERNRVGRLFRTCGCSHRSFEKESNRAENDGISAHAAGHTENGAEPRAAWGKRGNRHRGRSTLISPLPHYPACGSAPGGSVRKQLTAPQRVSFLSFYKSRNPTALESCINAG